MSFLDDIKEKAKKCKRKIVLPEAEDLRVIKAAAIASKEEIADIVLVGNKERILKIAGDIDLSRVQFEEPETSKFYEEYVNTFYELRKAKGITIEEAREKMKDSVYFGNMMVKLGQADGLVSGAIHSSADTLRPALQIIKTAPETSIVSSFFAMVVPNKNLGENGVFIFSDCGLVIAPNAEELSEIAISSANTFKTLVDKEPKIAMLSYSTKNSAKGDSQMKVLEATKLVKEKRPELIVDGELQLDAAIIPEVAKLKAPDSCIAGKANVLIFPDLSAGNIGYKLVERFANAEAYGPITQGIAKPVNDLSRGCKAEDIVGTIAITALQVK